MKKITAKQIFFMQLTTNKGSWNLQKVKQNKLIWNQMFYYTYDAYLWPWKWWLHSLIDSNIPITSRQFLNAHHHRRTDTLKWARIERLFWEVICTFRAKWETQLAGSKEITSYLWMTWWCTTTQFTAQVKIATRSRCSEWSVHLCKGPSTHSSVNRCIHLTHPSIGPFIHGAFFQLFFQLNGQKHEFMN